MTTRVSAGATAATGPFPYNSSLLARVTGVVRRPDRTFREIAARPRSVTIVAFTTGISALAGVVLAATTVGQLALVDQWERTAHAFGKVMTDADYATLIDISRYGPLYAVAGALLSGPVLSLAVSAGLHGLMRRRSHVRPSFSQVFAVVAHAGVILALRQAIAAPLGFARETTSNAMTLGAWFPMLDASSPLARGLGFVDLFAVWWAVVLAIGVGVVYQRRARTVAVAFLGAYAVLAILSAAVMAVAGGNA